MVKCKIGQIFDVVSDREKSALSNALTDRLESGKFSWSAKALANQVTNKTKFSFGATTVKEHRRQACGCFSELL